MYGFCEKKIHICGFFFRVDFLTFKLKAPFFWFSDSLTAHGESWPHVGNSIFLLISLHAPFSVRSAIYFCYSILRRCCTEVALIILHVCYSPMPVSKAKGIFPCRKSDHEIHSESRTNVGARTSSFYKSTVKSANTCSIIMHVLFS